MHVTGRLKDKFRKDLLYYLYLAKESERQSKGVIKCKYQEINDLKVRVSHT